MECFSMYHGFVMNCVMYHHLSKRFPFNGFHYFRMIFGDALDIRVFFLFVKFVFLYISELNYKLNANFFFNYKMYNCHRFITFSNLFFRNRQNFMEMIHFPSYSCFQANRQRKEYGLLLFSNFLIILRKTTLVLHIINVDKIQYYYTFLFFRSYKFSRIKLEVCCLL